MNMVNYDKQSVALLACRSYQHDNLKEKVGELLQSLSFSVPRGARILLKPNLVTGKSKNGLACTNPQFVAKVAEWFLDQGAIVTVGDSPAFGNAKQVMKACGIKAALDGLPVNLLNFNKKRVVKLACGVSIGVATDIFECDQLINLPKLKAHNQMLVSLAVKNLFGIVIGCRKALAHMRYGERNNLFAELLVDLLTIVPPGVSILDGVVGMHRDGPVAGQAYKAGIIGASRDPVALDTAILGLIGADPQLSPLWQECRRREMPGADPDVLHYPLCHPEKLAVDGFVLPADLAPIRFQLCSFLKNGVVKIFNKK